MVWNGIDIVSIDVHNTTDPVPREEGRFQKHKSTTFKNIGVGVGGLGVAAGGAGLGYAGLKLARLAPQLHKTAEAVEKSTPRYAINAILARAKRMFRMNARQRLIELAAGEYIRKLLPFEPLLARKGEEGYEPGVHREVQAALTHRQPPREAVRRAQAKELGKTAVLKSGYISHEIEGHKRMIPGVKIERPYRKTRAQMRQQQRSITEEPKAPEPMPGEMLPKQRGKMPVRGGSYEGVDLPRGLWSEKAAKPSEENIKYIYPEREHPHVRTPLTPEEISARARKWRDPMVSHQARVAAGVTPSLVEHRVEHVKNLPDIYLPHAAESEERRQAQALRDYLAGKAKQVRRDIVLPLRAQRRKALGLAPVKPMTQVEKQALWQKSEAMGTEIPKGRPWQPRSTPFTPGRRPYLTPSSKTMVAIGGGAELHPRTIGRLHETLREGITKATAHHEQKAKEIRGYIDARLTEAFGRIDQQRHTPQYGEMLKRTVEHLKNESFHPNRTLPLEDLDAKNLSEHLGTTPDFLKKLHKQYRHHIGLTTEKGEKKIRSALMLKLFKRVPEEASKAAYPLAKRLGKVGAIGAGVAGAAGLGTYLYKRHKQNAVQFEVPLKNLAQKLKGFRLTRIGKKEAILGGALAGGITAADAATSAVFPDPDKSRAGSAWAGAKRGAIYGTVLAGTELPLRRAIMKGKPLYHWKSDTKEIRFREEKQDLPRDIAIGGIEGGAGFWTTEKILKRLSPKTTPGKVGVAAAVGGAATGTIGYGLNRFLRSFKRKHKERQLAAKVKEIAFDSEGYTTAYDPKRRLTVAQDKYRKLVRSREIERKEANLAKTAAAGAGLGYLLGKRKGAGIGAAAGIVTSSALTLRNRRTRDPFGEESIAARRVERVPYQAAGLGIAGVLAHRYWKGRKLLSDRSRLIRFQQNIPLGEPSAIPEEWAHRQIGRWFKHPVGRVKESEKWLKRAGRLHRDIKLTRDEQGNIIDERGRTRTPEWKKPWFKSAIGTGVAVAGLVGAHRLWTKTGKTAEVATGLLSKGVHPSELSQSEQFALNLRSGNIWRAIKSKLPKTTGVTGRITGAYEGLRKEARQAKEGVFGRINKAVEGEVGEIQSGKVRQVGPEGRKRTILQVDNPAYAEENLKKLEQERTKLQSGMERIRRQRERAIQSQASRRKVEDIIKSKELNSRLKLIYFQDGDVLVRPHTRRARRQQYKSEKKGIREGFLLGAGGVGSLGAAIFGGKYALAKAASRAAHQRSINAEIQNRLSQITAKSLEQSGTWSSLLHKKPV